MKARLFSGEIVELEQDCACTHHDGPHWLYMDRFWRHKLSLELDTIQFNLSYIAETGDYSMRDLLTAQLQHVSEEAITRLNEKAFNFRKFGIVELVYD